jgi:hypothetical protein
MKCFDTFADILTDIFFDRGPKPQPPEKPPRVDRFGRPYQTREQLEAERVKFRKSLDRTEY